MTGTVRWPCAITAVRASWIRNGNDISLAFPDVVAALGELAADVVLDGELTIADDRGRPRTRVPCGGAP